MVLPDLGVGMICLPGLEPLVEAAQDLLDVIEIEPQASWASRGSGYIQDEDFLARVAGLRQPTLVHSVGFPVGGTVSPDPAAIRLLGDVSRRVAAPWVSEHLSFNRVADRAGEYGTLFLLPPIQTPESVAVAARNIASVSAALPVPFAFETGVNYLRPQPGELSDGAFFAAVAEAADCGILLDLHNMWCNEKNGRQPVLEALAELPLERVWEMHLAGGQEMDGFWLDAHSGLVSEEVMELAAMVIPALPSLHAVVVEIAPAYVTSGRVGTEDVLAQLGRLRSLWNSRGQAPKPARRAPAEDPKIRDRALPRPGRWESELGHAVVGNESAGGTGHEYAAADPGIEIIRHVVQRARAGMVAEALPRTVRLVLLAAGESRLHELFAGFWRSTPPEQFAGIEGQAFGRYLLDHGRDVPHLIDMVTLELAVLRAQSCGAPQTVLLGCDPLQLLEAIAAGVLPEGSSPDTYEVLVPAP